MGGTSSQIFWRQEWNSDAESLLKRSVDNIGCSERALASQDWDPRNSTIAGVRDFRLTSIGPAGSAWSSALLHLNSLLGKPLAKVVSKLQNEPVLLFFEFEQASWGYALYHAGVELDRFWSDPGAAGEPGEGNRGNAVVLAKTVGIDSSLIEPYLQRTSIEKKAFPDDEFPLTNHWVRVDFMRRLGIIYRNPSDNTWIQIIETGINDSD